MSDEMARIQELEAALKSIQDHLSGGVAPLVDFLNHLADSSRSGEKYPVVEVLTRFYAPAVEAYKVSVYGSFITARLALGPEASQKPLPTPEQLAIQADDEIDYLTHSGATEQLRVKNRPWRRGDGIWVLTSHERPGALDLRRCSPRPSGQ